MQTALSSLLLTLLLAPAGNAMLDCSKIRADKYNFDLSKLGGPHSVVTSKWDPDAEVYHNATFTVDICKPLKKDGKKKCPNGTRVCGIQRIIGVGEDGKPFDNIDKVFSISGELRDHGGGAFDVDATRLKTSDSNDDAEKEGLRLVLKGGKRPLKKSGTEQKTIIEFLCDKDKEGTEGEWETEDKYEKSTVSKRDDKNDEEEDRTIQRQLLKKDAALIWKSYKMETNADVLRLTWHTKYACEKRDDGDKGKDDKDKDKDGDKDKDKDGDKDKDKDGDEKDPESSSSSWGFFTWLFMITFLGIAAYLIFGSWLNYNRYGARGWDLLPHGDTIRDIPYLLKDWVRRILNTVQGAGSRGGYSAV